MDGPVSRTGAVPQRKPGELVPRSYELRDADPEGKLAALEPGRIGPGLARSETLDQKAQLEAGLSPSWPFKRVGLLDLPQARLDALWPSLADKIGAWVKSASGIHHHGRGVEEGAELVPLVWNDALRVVPLKAAAVPLVGGNARLVGPTTAGGRSSYGDSRRRGRPRGSETWRTWRRCGRRGTRGIGRCRRRRGSSRAEAGFPAGRGGDLDGFYGVLGEGV